MYIVLRFPWWFLQWEWLIKKNKQSKFNIEGGKDNNMSGEKILKAISGFFFSNWAEAGVALKYSSVFFFLIGEHSEEKKKL